VISRPDGLQRFSDLEAEYEILRELGRGGTAVVYLARERALDREVAIKVIRATYVEDDGAAARLMREARTVGQLQHPNIVMLYGTRRLTDGSLALIMQYVRGGTLKEEVRARGPLPFERAEAILLDLTRGLACAQRHRIVHRDIKPENIYLDAETGIARLSDFGIARPWDAECSLTLPGMAIGTPAYMSPEQIDGGAVDGRSDIYSLGLVGYEMLTGRAPWAGETLYSTIYKQKHEDLPSVDELRPGVPAKLGRVIRRALQKDPAGRWQDAEAMVAALLAPALDAPKPRRHGGTGKGGRSKRGRSSKGVASGATPVMSLEDSETVVYRRPVAGPPPAGGAADPAATSGVAGAPGTAATAGPGGAVSAEGAAGTLGAGGAAGAGKASPRRAAGTSPPTGDGSRPAADNVPAAGATLGNGAPRRSPAGVERPIQPAFVEEPMGQPAVQLGSRRVRNAVSAVVLASVLVGTPVMVALRPGITVAQAGRHGSAVAAAAPEVAVPAGEGLAAALPAAEAATGGGVPAIAFPLYGDAQQGTAGDTLPAPLVLRVEDAGGRPVSGAEVSFAVLEGAGSVLPDRVVTDANGLATTRWLPAEPGTHVVEAHALGTEERVAFRARVLPRAGARLIAVESPETRGAASSRLAVRVEDDDGRPVAGAEVRFAVRSGGGRVEPARAVSGQDGVARAEWVHGRGASQEAEARLPNRDAPVLFSASAAPSARVAVRSGVTTGGTHTCVLAGDGAASCWGGNESGQLGGGAAGRRTGAVRVGASEPLAMLAAGVSHTCAVGVSGAAFCWGANASGQLGDGTRVGRPQPVRVRSDASFVEVFAGMSHSCALDSDGGLHCWGENGYGQLGNGSSRNSRDTPVRVAGGRTFRTAAVGWAHTCALDRDGRGWCWGRNSSGELGDGSTTDRTRPVAVAGGHRFSAIAVGSGHTCGLRADGMALCWGQNTHGELGSGGGAASTVPVTVAAAEPFMAITLGGVHTCGLTRAGTALCWGRNTYGQLGDGSTRARQAPVAVAGGLRFRSVQASGAHTCGTTVEGAEYCWGYNIDGQLGDGTRTNQPRPAAVGRGR
jgi:alpha-tubulin suppressor-like RCC1 family protein